MWGDGFEVETLIHVRVASAGLHVAEVPSFEHPRLHGASNLKAPRDGMRVLRTILSERQRAQASDAERPDAPIGSPAATEMLSAYVPSVRQLDCAELDQHASLFCSEAGVGADLKLSIHGKRRSAHSVFDDD